MPRVRITSQSQALYVGPAPSTGFHFINASGDPTGDVNSTNLLKQLNGLQSINYEILNNRVPISELGRRATVKRAIITPPSVNLNFSYLASDLKNEIRMGFDVNFHTGHSYTDSYYANNTGTFCLSGFLSRDSYPTYSGFDTVDNDVFTSSWPYADRDKRNLFLGIAPEGADIKDISDEQYNQLNCVSFGDCHLSSYEVDFNLNSPIMSRVGYECANIQYHGSGSGLIPAMNTSDFTPVNDNIFVIPKYHGELSSFSMSGISISGSAQPLRIGDMGLRITAPKYGAAAEDIKDAGINFRDLSVQNAKVSIDINRYAWKGLGHKLPIDRPIKYPIVVRVELTSLMGDTATGDFYNFITKDYPYDVQFDCRAPTFYCSGNQNDVRLRYDIHKANLDNFTFSNEVNEGRTVDLTYITDVAENIGGQGIFMSGMVFETGFPFSGFNF